MSLIRIFCIIIGSAIFSGCNDAEKRIVENEPAPVLEDSSEMEENLLISNGGAGSFELGKSISEVYELFEIEKTTQTRIAEGQKIKETVYIISENGKHEILLKPQLNSAENKDLIGEIIIVSEDYQTAKGIGVNSTLTEFQKVYPDHKIWYTYVSDRYILETPELEAQFFLDEKDFTGEIKITSAQEPLKASEFVKGTKIQKIRLF